MTHYYVGIDPGAKGSIAYVPEDKKGYWTDPMPSGDKEIWDAVRKIPTWFWQEETTVCIERIDPGFKGTGKVQMCKLYGNYCRLSMALEAAGIKAIHVHAKVWQSALGLKRFKDETRPAHKRRMKVRAQDVFTGVRVTEANADALLLALYLMNGGTR